MAKHATLALGVLGSAVVLIVVGVIFPMVHAAATIGGMSVLGVAIIMLLVMALGIVVRGSRKRTA